MLFTNLLGVLSLLSFACALPTNLFNLGNTHIKPRLAGYYQRSLYYANPAYVAPQQQDAENDPIRTTATAMPAPTVDLSASYDEKYRVLRKRDAVRAVERAQPPSYTAGAVRRGEPPAYTVVRRDEPPSYTVV